ncbi:hypothetical protein [Beijerinckia indica]|uniref:Uncharacterized protein n=1 Tax=Beijerinckia indica subsp. indica (strain ATCC 9039 / DSM 1715 / NCIMB 8712) TaxID=395963 RepID=B2IHA5_BEII9|nr:hypothetical protein [Beijerinckia indica]ACB95890.1 hypothetical protein Bind_2274 [Beijerinckia indica subsp. indica ATCC 9039]
MTNNCGNSIDIGKAELSKMYFTSEYILSIMNDLLAIAKKKKIVALQSLITSACVEAERCRDETIQAYNC